jgi:hypothetical protein
MSVSETEAGRELVVEWAQIDRGSWVGWVLKLAEFDRDALWAVDGFNNCVSWLEIKCGMGRTTAFEKVRVAHELDRRPMVRAAFAHGSLAFTKAQLITRLEGLDHARDAAFVADAEAMSVRALEARVKNWNYFNSRDEHPNLDDHYGLRRASGFMDGYGQLVLEGPNDMLDRVVAVVDAYGQFLFHNDPVAFAAAVDKSRHGTPDDTLENERGPFTIEATRPRAAKRLDWFLDLVEEVALHNADKLDPEIASIGVTVQYEDLINHRRTLVPTDQGSFITGEAACRLACDAGVHRMIVRGVSEFLDIGRKTRTWTVAQRRTIRARHNHRCAVEGCNRRITQIHHIVWWENGGDTAIDNGVPLCSYHHHLVHEGGWTITWNPHTGVTRLEGPNGQILESRVRIPRAA